MIRPMLRVTLAVSIIVLVATGPAWGATWQATGLPFGGATEDVLLSAAADGTVYARGTVSGQGLLSARPPFGPFAEPLASPAAGANAPAIDFDGAGNGVALATALGVLKSAYKPAGAPAGFGSAQTVVSQTAFAGVSVTPAGDALAAWAPYPGPGAVAYADRPAGASSTFGAPAAPTGNPTADGGFGLAVVIPILDADGSATIIYTTYSGGMTTVHQVSRTSAGAAFGGDSIVAPNIGAIGASVNARGDAVVIWQSGGSIMASYRPHDGTFGAAELAATPSSVGSGFSFSSSQLGVDADGRVLLVWGDLVAGCGTTKRRIATMVRGTNGSWGGQQTTDGLTPVLGMSKSGNRFVLLYRVTGGAEADHCIVSADRAVADTGQDGVLALTPVDLPGQTVSTQPTGSDNPKAAAIDPAGNAYVLWTDGAAGPRKAAALESGTPPPGGGGAGGGGGQTTPTGATPTPTPTVPTPTLDALGQFLASAPGFIRTSKPTDARLIIECKQGTCTIIVDGQMLVYASGQTGRARGAASKKPKVFKLGRVRLTLAGGKKKTVTMPLPKAARTAAKAALGRGQKVQVTFTVTNNGAKRKAVTTFKRR